MTRKKKEKNPKRHTHLCFCTAEGKRTLHAYGSSGCVGCYKNPAKTSTVDVPSNGLNNENKEVKRPSTSEDFWTTSTHDNMDNSAGQSQGSMSSTGATNQALAPHGGSCKTSDPDEFVNHGLILWNQTRQRWVGKKRPENRIQQLREPKLRLERKKNQHILPLKG